MLPVKRGRGRPPKFNSAPNSPKPTSPVPNGFAENGKLKKFKYKRFVTMDSPVDEVINFSFYSYCITWNSIQGSQKGCISVFPFKKCLEDKFTWQ